MSTTKLLSGAPVTQSIEAVVSLLKYLGKPSDPLPEAVQLPGAMLVLSNRKNSFHVTVLRSCSCPAATYRPSQQCKHQRKYFPENGIKRQNMAETLAQADQNLTRMPTSYQRMVRAARDEAEAEPLELKPKGSFKPFLE